MTWAAKIANPGQSWLCDCCLRSNDGVVGGRLSLRGGCCWRTLVVKRRETMMTRTGIQSQQSSRHCWRQFLWGAGWRHCGCCGMVATAAAWLMLPAASRLLWRQRNGGNLAAVTAMQWWCHGWCGNNAMMALRLLW